MGKRIAGMIVGLVVVLLLVVAMVFFMNTKSPTAVTSSEEVSASVYLIQKDQKTLTDITVKNEQGTFKVERDKSSFGIKELKDFDKYQDNYNEIVQFGYSLAASSEVEKSTNDLEKYGLKSPIATAKMNFTDGDSITVYVGNKSAGGTGYYVRTNKLKGVYILSEAKTERFLDNKLNYISTSVTSTDDLETETVKNQEGQEEQQAITPEIKSFTVRRKDLKKPINFIPTRARSEDDQLAALECLYELNSPFNATLSSDTGSEPVSGFYGISAESVVQINPTSADLNKYGFNDPTTKLVMVAKQKKYSHTVTFGKGVYCNEEKPEKGHKHEITGYYCIADNAKIVYKVDKESIPWLTLDVKDIMSEYVVNPVLNEVKTIKIAIDNKNYRFDITGEKGVSASEGTDAVDSTKIAYNGKQLNLTKFRSFYMFLNAITADSIVDEKPTGKAKMTIEYIYRKNTRKPDKIELLPYRNSTMAVALNGDASIVTRSAFIDRAIENIQKVITNKEINPTW